MWYSGKKVASDQTLWLGMWLERPSRWSSPWRQAGRPLSHPGATMPDLLWLLSPKARIDGLSKGCNL
jgi:hypothetical protein